MRYNNLFFDETPVLKDFASFFLNEVAKKPSIFEAIKGIFKKNPEVPWNSVFCFDYIEKSHQFIVGVGKFLYKISIKNGKSEFSQLDSNIRSVVFNPMNDNVIILFDSFIRTYDLNFTKLSETTNGFNILGVFRIKSCVYLLSKSSVYSLDDMAPKIETMRAWKVFTFCEDMCAIVGKTATIFLKNLSTIQLESRFNNAISAAFSSDNKYLYILDDETEVYVYNVADGFSLRNKIHVSSSVSVHSWDENHFLVGGSFGTIYFVTHDGQIIKTQNITPSSIIRSIKNGAIVFEPQESVGESTHFDIVMYSVVSPYELYLRNCQQGFFADALNLMKSYSFDSDIYHKSYLLKNEFSKKSIEDHLKQIKDQEFQYNFCLTYVTPNPDLLSSLIKYALQIKPNDSRLQSIKERLMIFNKISKNGFIEEEWIKFRDCSLSQELVVWAKRMRFSDISTVFKYSQEVDDYIKKSVVNAISPFVSPIEYEELMPMSSEYFIERGNEIDQRTGLAAHLIELFRIGSTRFPNLKSIFEYSLEYDHIIASTNDEKTYISLQFSAYSQLSDVDKVMLMIEGCQNGKQAYHILKNSPNSLTEKYTFTIPQVLRLILLDNNSIGKIGIIEKISFIPDIILLLPKDTMSKTIDDTLLGISYPLSSSVLEHIISKLGHIASSNLLSVLHICCFITEYQKNIIINDIVNGFNQIIVNDLASTMITSDTLTLELWKKFISVLRKLIISNSQYQIDMSTVNEFNLCALLKFSQWDSIEIKSIKETQTVVNFVEKLMSRAKTCKEDDPILIQCLTYLSMIPSEFSTHDSKRLFEKINVYHQISKIDPEVLPVIIDKTVNYTDLIIIIIEKYSNTDNIEPFYKLCRKVVSNIGNVNSNFITRRFCQLAYTFGCIDFGISLIDYAEDELIIDYLHNPNWHDNEKKLIVCIKRIKNCSSKLLEKFISIFYSILSPQLSYKLDDSSKENMQNSILRYISFSEEPSSIAFALSFLCKNEVYERLRRMIETQANIMELLFLIKKIYSYQYISLHEYEELIVIIVEKVSNLNDSIQKIEIVEQILNSGIQINSIQLWRVYLQSIFIKNYAETRDPSCFESMKNVLEIWSSTKFSVIDMIKILFSYSFLVKDDPEEKALTAIQCRELENRTFSVHKSLWEKILDNESEIIILNRTKDIRFGFQSKHNEVITLSYELLKTEQAVPISAIDEIVDREEIHMLIGTVHFAKAVKRAKTQTQLRKIFFSLKLSENTNVLIDVFSQILLIPGALLDNDSNESIISTIGSMLNIWTSDKNGLT